MIPYSFTSAAVAIISGQIVSRVGDYRWTMWFGWSVFCIGMGLMIMLSDTSSNAVKVIFPFIAGTGMGCLFQTPLIGLQAAMPLKDRATSTATFGLIRLLGGTVGVAIGQAIYTSQLSRRLGTIPNLPSDTTAQSLAQEVRRIKLLDPAIRQAVRHAFARSISTIWIVNTPIIGIGLFVVLFMRKYPLHMKTRVGTVVEGGKESSLQKGKEVEDEDEKVVEDEDEKVEKGARSSPDLKELEAGVSMSVREGRREGLDDDNGHDFGYQLGEKDAAVEDINAIAETKTPTPTVRTQISKLGT